MNGAVVNNRHGVGLAIQVLSRLVVVFRRNIHFANRSALHVEDIDDERHRCRRLVEVHVAVIDIDNVSVINCADSHRGRLGGVFLGRTQADKRHAFAKFTYLPTKARRSSQDVDLEVAFLAKSVGGRVHNNQVEVHIGAHPVEVFFAVFIQIRIVSNRVPRNHVAIGILLARSCDSNLRSIERKGRRCLTDGSNNLLRRAIKACKRDIHPEGIDTRRIHLAAVWDSKRRFGVLSLVEGRTFAKRKRVVLIYCRSQVY